MKARILIVDDEKNIREVIQSLLEEEGYKADCSEDGQSAWDLINKNYYDLVLTDLRMPKLDGMQLLKKITTSYPTIPVLVITGHGTIETAVQAMQNGALDFITKPINIDRLLLLVQRSLENNQLKLQNDLLRKELESLKAKQKFDKLIGKSRQMIKLMQTISQVAATKVSVLITGESGTGKELVAQALYELSDRRDKSFIKVHCASLSEGLLESELFGHEKGSFTNAISQKKGRFELADNGTIFLDEIGDISQNVQIKILRVLQERSFERVGGEKTLNVNIRLISATNKNLEEEIKNGNFREDLYYRLNVVHIHVPPLRERKDDISLLVSNFMDEFSKENNKKVDKISNQALGHLYAYDWPGNIRQLRNCIESALVMCKRDTITKDDLPPYVLDGSKDFDFDNILSLEEAEKLHIKNTLAATKGNVTKASEILKIGRNTLYRKLGENKEE